MAMVVAVPLAIRGLGASRTAAVATSFAGLTYGAALWLGEWTFALPWLGATLLIAAVAARRFAGRGLRGWAESSIDAGCLMLPIGAAWAVAWVAGIEPLDTQGVWVLLTAIHFHWAAFVLPVVVGGFGRLVGNLPGALVAMVIVFAIPMTAIGIAWSEPIERVAATTLAIAATVFAFTLLRRPAFWVSAVALGTGMALALTFVHRAGPVVLSIDEMVLFHGTLNAVWFGLGSLLVVNWQKPGPRWSLQVPFSKLRGDLRLGANFFERHNLVAEGTARGLVDRLDELAGSDFDPAPVHVDIRDFYENTTDYDLHVTPHWESWAAWAGALWYRLATRMEQTVFPAADAPPQDIRSVVFPLDADRDGRRLPRAWVRTFPDGRSMYVAAYATHVRDGRAYMNIAFPFWRSNMASILYPANLGESGLRLDTYSRGDTPDAGIWMVTPLGPIRLPLREFIDVWVDEDDVMRARHELRAWGIRYLALDYVMHRPSRPGDDARDKAGC